MVSEIGEEEFRLEHPGHWSIMLRMPSKRARDVMSHQTSSTHSLRKPNEEPQVYYTWNGDTNGQIGGEHLAEVKSALSFGSPFIE